MGGPGHSSGGRAARAAPLLGAWRESRGLHTPDLWTLAADLGCVGGGFLLYSKAVSAVVILSWSLSLSGLRFPNSLPYSLSGHIAFHCGVLSTIKLGLYVQMEPHHVSGCTYHSMLFFLAGDESTGLVVQAVQSPFLPRLDSCAGFMEVKSTARGPI